MARTLDASHAGPLRDVPHYESDIIASVVRLVAICMNTDFQGDILSAETATLPAIENRDVSLVYAIATNPPLRPSAIAEALATSPYTVSRGLARLAAHGVIERLPDPSDARATLVQLTEAGRAAAEHLIHAGDRLVASVMRDWNEPDQARFEQLLHRFVDALAERATTPASPRG